MYAVHATTEKAMVRWSDGTKEQIQAYHHYDNGEFLNPDMTGEEQKSLVYLHREAETATKKYEAYCQKFSINLHDLVQRAHADAVKSLREGEED